MSKKWELACVAELSFFSLFPNINPIILQLLYNRGIKDGDAINKFLHPSFEKDLHDPFLFNDMKKVAVRILRAIKEKEKILVYGDYDADGVSSSVLMVTLLQALGGTVGIYIPHREIEGYGLGVTGVDYVISNSYKLVITVDCGISNKQEVKNLQNAGVDVIVTDHHSEPIELPDSFAIINPQIHTDGYPFNKLAGVGVAFKVAQGVLRYAKEQSIDFHTKEFLELGGYDGLQKWLLDVVSIGTVADCMPLLDENRVLVKYGLRVIGKTKRIGLEALMRCANINLAEMKTYNIGFQIAPRINAAGRLDHANVAYELLMSKDQSRANELALQLDRTNIERQEMTERILSEIKAQISRNTSASVVCAVGSDWLAGVVGLVAGKLIEYYNKPVIVMTRSKGNISGSGRSLQLFDMIGALQKLDRYFSAYGGHKMACGFTLKDNDSLDSFVSEINDIARKAFDGVDLTPVVKVDRVAKFSEIDFDLIKNLEELEPFGYGNPEPIFRFDDVEVMDVSGMGKMGAHLRFSLRQSGLIKNGVAFGVGQRWGDKIKKGDKIDIVSTISINRWNGNTEIQLKLIDIGFK